MAAFQFPDPSTGQTTVVNPITGSTYQWKEPPGKWVVATKVRQVEDIIWEGDAPPDPIGDYKLWYSTDTLELYFYYTDANGTSAWLPTSAPITMLEDLDEGLFEVRQLLNQVNSAAITNENDIILIRESLGKVNFQEVLDNGNVADKGFVLTNLADDAILVSPEQARIMVGGVGPSVVPKIELRHETGALDTSLVALELDEDGARFDIECDEKVDNIHFRFEDDVKFELNKSGDAKFSGGAEFKDRVTIDRPALGQANSFVVRGGIRNNDNQVVIGSMLRAYHDSTDLTKDSGIEYKGKIFNDNNLVNKGYVDVTDEAHSEAIGELQSSVILLQQEIEELSEVVNKAIPYKLITDKNDTQNILRDGAFYFGDCPNGSFLEITDDWSGVCFIFADTKDANSDFADFGPDTLDEGDLIEGISRDGSGYFLVEVGANGGYDLGGGKRIAGIEARVIKASGVPGPSGKDYLLTAFRLSASGGIDLPTADERYVNAAGDKMTGTLETTSRVLIRPNNQGASGKNNMLVVNQSTANGDGSIVRFQQDGEDIVKVQADKSTLFRDHLQVTHPTATDGTYLFSVKAPGLESGQQVAFRVTADGNVKAGHNTANPFIAEVANDVVTKAALDEAVAAVKGGSGGLFEPTTWTLDLNMDRDETTKGKFYADDDDFYMSTSNANNLTWVPGAAGGRTTNAWVTIYSTAGKLMHTYEVNKIYFKEKYGKKYITEFEWAWHYKTNNLVDGEQYKIIVPGFLT